MKSNASSTSKVFLAVIVLSGFAVLANAVLHVSSADPVRFVCFLLVACVAARLKVKLPGLTGNMSVNLPFILVAIAAMSTSEAMAIACFSTLVQCLPSATKRFNVAQALFNFCNMALAVGAAVLILKQPSVNAAISSHTLVVALSAAAFFVVNTVPVAVIISLTEARSALRTWGNLFQLSFPYFVLSASIAALVVAASQHPGWQAPLLLLPIMFGVFQSYKRYFANVEIVSLPMAKAVAAS